jgi:hypothetical protein
MRVCMSSWHVRSVHASFPDGHTCAHISSSGVSSACFEGIFPNLEVLLLCREYELETDVYAQVTHQFLMRILSAHISFWRVCSVCFEGTAPSAHTSFGLLCSMHTSVPYVHAVGIQTEHLKIWETDVHAEHARKKLISLIRMCIIPCRAHSVYASVPGPYAQCGHAENTLFQEHCICVCRSQNFLLTRALLNLLRKGLGRSKLATLPHSQALQHILWRIQPYPSSLRTK